MIRIGNPAFWSCTVLAGLLAMTGQANGQVGFEPSQIDVGQVRIGQRIERRVRLVNRSPEPVQIVDVKGSCGCLKPVVEPDRIPGKGEAWLHLRINTLSAAAGLHAWRIQVRYQIGNRFATAVLPIRARCRREILVQPPSLQVYSSRATQHEILVNDLRPKPFRILRVETTARQMRASLAPSDGTMPCRVFLQILEDLPPGEHHEQVVIFTDDPQYRDLRVDVVVHRRKRKQIRCLPPRVDVVASEIEPRPTRLVRLRHASGQPLIIDRIRCNHPAISCEQVWNRGPAVTLRITIDANRIADSAVTSKVEVFFAKPAGSKVVIPVTCERRN